MLPLATRRFLSIFIFNMLPDATLRHAALMLRFSLSMLIFAMPP